MQSGAVWTWGFGGYGALGHGDRADRLAPAPVEALLGRAVVAASCGSYASAAVTREGSVHTWGWGRHGQLGHGAAGNSPWPRAVAVDRDGVLLPPARAIACGHAHMVHPTPPLAPPPRPLPERGRGREGERGGVQERQTETETGERERERREREIKRENILAVACGHAHMVPPPLSAPFLIYR